MDSNVDLPAGVELPKIHFGSKDRFPKQTNFVNDSAFFRQSKRKNKHMNSDSLTAFLQGQMGDGVEMNSIEKLLDEELEYKDLASLSERDLELIGFKYRIERENLLKFFAQLPNQDPTFEELCNQPEAQQYNSIILNNANRHLKNMQHAMLEANYKLQTNIPEDVLVGDKYFASHFLIDALNELNGATDEIKSELDELSKVVNEKRQNSKDEYTRSRKWFLMALAAGLAAAATCWLVKSHQQ